MPVGQLQEVGDRIELEFRNGRLGVALASLAGAPLAIAIASAAAKRDFISASGRDAMTPCRVCQPDALLLGPLSQVDDDDGDGGRERGKGGRKQDDRDNRIHGLRIRENAFVAEATNIDRG